MSLRKSTLGQRPAVTEPPPRAPGKPWWTDPPISEPDPSHIRYAKRFRAELASRVNLESGRRRQETTAVLVRVNAWLKAANSLAQESEHARLGLGTTDDLIVEALRLVRRLGHRVGWDTMEAWDQRVVDALQRRAQAILAERSGRRGV